MQFISRAAVCSNITGEMVTEAQVVEAMEAVATQLQTTISFCVASPDAPRRRYLIFVELEAPAMDDDLKCLAYAFDDHLSRLNSEYAAQRARERLHAPTMKRLRPGSLREYQTAVLSRGGREAQIKLMFLSNDRSARVLLDELVFTRRQSPPGVAS